MPPSTSLKDAFDTGAVVSEANTKPEKWLRQRCDEVVLLTQCSQELSLNQLVSSLDKVGSLELLNLDGAAIDSRYRNRKVFQEVLDEIFSSLVLLFQ